MGAPEEPLRVAPPVLVGILGLGCGLGPDPAPVVHPAAAHARVLDSLTWSAR